MVRTLAVMLAALGLSLMSGQLTAESRSIEVEALLGSAAVLKVNGQRKMLKVGQSFEGVTLINADAKSATLEFDGRQQTVGLSRRITSNFEEPKEQRITIARDDRMQYQTTALINGRGARVLIDTGANIMALSSTQAKALGIDYFVGEPSRVETASGVASAYVITLQSVSVGGIQVDNVPATVVEGDYPGTVLLGMSYLRHVKMQEHNGILSLSRTP